jgi:NADH:ubiquinone oxidoreductase subunit E
MKIQICNGKVCKGKFSEYIMKRITQDISKFNLENVAVETCPCLGCCAE